MLLIDSGLILKIKQTLYPSGAENPELPRFGMKVSINETFDNLEWFGRGPHESYWDRKTRIGVCADWFIGSKVESAWLSANDLGKKILRLK